MTTTDIPHGISREEFQEAIGNPYWYALRDWPLDTYGENAFEAHPYRSPHTDTYRKRSDLEKIDRIMAQGLAQGLGRSALTKKYGWSIPSPEAIGYVVDALDGRPVVEIGCGTGYWAAMLTQAGVDVHAYDKKPPRLGWNHYHNESRPALVDTKHGKLQLHELYGVGTQEWHPVIEGNSKALLYPENAERVLFLSWPPYNSGMGGKCIKRYQGDTIIYIGEGDGGCTGGPSMWKRLRKDWDVVETHDIPHWSSVRDSITIYRRAA